MAELNTLLASPKLATWLRGAPLDPEAWLARRDDGRSPAVIASVAHLDGEEREAVLAVLLDAILAWARSLPGTSELRALIVLDGVIVGRGGNGPAPRPLAGPAEAEGRGATRRPSRGMPAEGPS